MEKRLVVAFMLTYLIVMFWMKGAAPVKPADEAKTTQIIENNYDTSVVGEQNALKSLSSIPSVEKTDEIDESLESIENPKIKVVFSNNGGGISSVTVKEYNETLPLTQVLGNAAGKKQLFKVKERTDNYIIYEGLQDGVSIEKKHIVSANDYLVTTVVSLHNSSGMSKDAEIVLSGYSLDVNRLDKNIKKKRDRSLLEYSVSLEDKVFRKTNAVSFNSKEEKTEVGPVKWIGFRNRYFCAVIKPLFKPTGYVVDVETKEKINIGLIPPKQALPQGEQVEYEFTSFFGPQNLVLLKDYDLGYDKIMVFFRLKFFDAIAKGIYKFIIFLHRFVPNWGVCVILVSFMIYGAMYPLTMKGMRSMKNMQALQPEIAKLKEQHKSNPQKLNKEMMELYKEHKINPLGGCFPLLLQMPIFIGLYQVLWRSVFFKGAGFLWIKDLSEPDRLFKFPFEIPILGEYLNLLPILMVIVMALQQRLSAKNMNSTDPSQVAQQKMMMTFFPIFLGFIFYNFASGLSLYFTIFYLLSTFSQWKISKSTKVG